jgi:protein disulfide-isomerase A1
MISRILSFLFLAFSLAEIKEEDSVWVLTDENFEDAFLLQAEILVEFYAPWCGHCKKLAPEYSKAAKRLKSHSIQIAKVDGTTSQNLTKKYDIQGYPTLKYFIGSKPVEYTGGRTEDSIVSWILKKTGNSLIVIQDLDSLKAKLAKTKVAAVLFSQTDSKEHTLFGIVSKSVDDLTFYSCPDPQALVEFQVKPATVVVFKQFDDKRVDYSGVFSTNEIIKFVEKNKRPWVVRYDENVDQVVHEQKKNCLIVFRHESEGREIEKVLKKISRQLEGKVIFAVSDLSTEENRKLVGQFGIPGKKQPAALLLDSSNEAKYFKDGPISEESLKQFLKDWKAKKLDPLLKSQDPPAKDIENFVKVLVGKTFESIVMDNKKDVLVEFYAPWCKHCKDLAPKYEQLAKRLRNVESVVICKIDATANEVKGIKIEGYPTIKFFPANNKKGLDYRGDHEVESLMNFIKARATFPINKEEL